MYLKNIFINNNQNLIFILKSFFPMPYKYFTMSDIFISA